jgi:hypothetical protein
MLNQSGPPIQTKSSQQRHACDKVLEPFRKPRVMLLWQLDNRRADEHRLDPFVV